MNDALIVTPQVERSELSDGTEVYTAYASELPGVVSEGATPAAAISELMASVHHLREHLGLRQIGFHTDAVRAWRWASYSADRVDVLSTQNTASYPHAHVLA